MPSENVINMHGLLADAVVASIKAGEAILEVYASDFTVEHKKDSSPLTLADRRSHEIISRQILTSGNISLPLLSEEGRDIPHQERKDWEYFWLVDPLDRS